MDDCPIRDAEEALYDIQSMRAFAGLELGHDTIPDETTTLNFHHLLERHDLAAIFAAVAEQLAGKGEMLRGGAIVDATLIAALPRGIGVHKEQTKVGLPNKLVAANFSLGASTALSDRPPAN